MSRKTSKEYSKEHQDLLIKIEALEARIKKRTLDMCEKFPDAPVGEITNAKKFKELSNEDPENDFYVQTYIRVMSRIEEYNKGKDIQTTIFPK